MLDFFAAPLVPLESGCVHDMRAPQLPGYQGSRQVAEFTVADAFAALAVRAEIAEQHGVQPAARRRSCVSRSRFHRTTKQKRGRRENRRD